MRGGGGVPCVVLVLVIPAPGCVSRVCIEGGGYCGIVERREGGLAAVS